MWAWPLQNSFVTDSIFNGFTPPVNVPNLNHVCTLCVELLATVFRDFLLNVFFAFRLLRVGIWL